MSNQIVISSGAKVRDLNGVLTGTSGVVNSLGVNVPDGIPQLDGNGKILVAQLPNSVMEYKGTWNVSTNTPTLANGTGNQGDVYLVEGAASGGTAFNFGAGPITFYNGDQVVYSGSIWQRASGSTGTVTSVAVTESGDALTITGSPITNSGTINIGFAGTGSQYIKGDGTLATFPTTIDQAKKLITEVYNSTGATLTKGTIVYINGGQGNLPTITKAIATGDATSAQTYGVVQSDITNNNNGFVVVIGSLGDLDTQSYAAGTQLYLSGTTAGAWTSTKPSAPIHLVYIAIVVRSHPTQGVVEVRIQNGYELDELHDVAITSVANTDGIFYNSSNDLWENKTIAEVLGYTPANDSLVVKLAGTQTISGAKTFGTFTQFSGDIYANASIISAAVGSASQTIIQNTNSVGLVSSGANRLGFNTNDNLSISSDGKGYAVFAFNNPGTGYTYTFPEVSGTVALTSNLSSYLPLSGGTLTGTLNGTNIVLSGSITSNTLYTTNELYYVAPAGVTSLLTLYLAGALSGTSATFTSGIFNNGTNSTNGIQVVSSLSSSLFTGGIEFLRTTTIGGSKIEPLRDASVGGVGLNFLVTSNNSAETSGTYTTALSILNTGAATFSNSVTAVNAVFERPNDSGVILRIGNAGSTYFDFSRSSTTGALSIQGNQTGNNNILLAPTSGNVGIGTSSPSYKLSVQGANATDMISWTDAINNTGYLGIRSGGVVWMNADNNLAFGTGGSERMRITSGGDVGIGTSTISWASVNRKVLELNGVSDTLYGMKINGTQAGYMYHDPGDMYLSTIKSGAKIFVTAGSGGVYLANGGTSWTSNSDERLKDINSNIYDALSKLMTLRAVNFSWKSDNTNKENLGLIAQDVEKVFPQVIDKNKLPSTPDNLQTDETEYLGVRYQELVPVLIAAIQELKAEIDELKNK